jgi:hypothetical protein
VAEKLLRLPEPNAKVEEVRPWSSSIDVGDAETLKELFSWNTAEARDAVCYALILNGYGAYVEAYLQGERLDFVVQGVVNKVLYRLKGDSLSFKAMGIQP